MNYTMELSKIPLYALSPDILTIPAFQRELVWSEAKKRALIDTILRNLPIQPLMVVKEDTIFGPKISLLDGQQRYRAIIEFIQCKYSTSKRPVAGGNLIPVYPGLFYSELPPEAKARFDKYGLPVVEMGELDAVTQGELFRRLQTQEKLSGGEILYSMNKIAVTVFEDLLNHRYFGDLYTKKSNRKETFQICTIMMMIEKSVIKSGYPYSNVTTPRKGDAVRSISIDDRSVVERIKKRLDNALRLYKGMEYTSISETVAIYQSIVLLELEGINFRNSEAGLLSQWHIDIREKSSNLTGKYKNGFVGIYSLDQVDKQHKFWNEQIPRILQIPGIIFLDERRSFTQQQKNQIFILQNGLCADCGLELKNLGESVAHHVKPYSEGGKTDIDNCKLFHKICHDKQHGY